MVYYRHLFENMRELSANEGLVYSALLAHSLMTPEHFNPEGKLDASYVKAYIMDHVESCGHECIDLIPVSVRRLAKNLGMTWKSVNNIVMDLRYKHHLIDDNTIFCPIELLDAGYLDIPPDTGLKGQQLVFYGLLLDRSKFYHGVIDTWASRLGEIAGIKKDSVYDLLYKLHRKGYVERLPDGKLKIK